MTVLENELTYENEHPNIVVLVEGTMVKGWDYMRGMPPGGTLVINTHYTPEYMIRFVPGRGAAGTAGLRGCGENGRPQMAVLPAWANSASIVSRPKARRNATSRLRRISRLR